MKKTILFFLITQILFCNADVTLIGWGMKYKKNHTIIQPPFPTDYTFHDNIFNKINSFPYGFIFRNTDSQVNYWVSEKIHHHEKDLQNIANIFTFRNGFGLQNSSNHQLKFWRHQGHDFNAITIEKLQDKGIEKIYSYYHHKTNPETMCYVATRVGQPPIFWGHKNCYQNLDTNKIFATNIIKTKTTRNSIVFLTGTGDMIVLGKLARILNKTDNIIIKNNVTKIATTNHAIAYVVRKKDEKYYDQIKILSANPQEQKTIEYLQQTLKAEQVKITNLVANSYAFALSTDNYNFITWGCKKSGGSTNVQLIEKIKLHGGVKEIIPSARAFAILTNKKSVFTIGHPNFGGENDLLDFNNVKQVISNGDAFAMLNEQNEMLVCGNKKNGGDLNYPDTDKNQYLHKISNVKAIYATRYIDKMRKMSHTIHPMNGAFAAILDGHPHLFTWGNPLQGGDHRDILEKLSNHEIVSIHGGYNGFVALIKPLSP